VREEIPEREGTGLAADVPWYLHDRRGPDIATEASHDPGPSGSVHHMALYIPLPRAYRARCAKGIPEGFRHVPRIQESSGKGLSAEIAVW